MSRQWTTQNLPNMRGKVAIVTGGNTGLGFQSALALAQAGCKVIIACRNLDKGSDAVNKIVQSVPDADVVAQWLDLTDFASIKSFAISFMAVHEHLDVLLNNGGVVNLSELQHTKQGHEMHFATNHLGHFCLTGQLMPVITMTPDARVITVSSGGYKFGEIQFDDLDWRKRAYHRVKCYGDSKLANMLFFQYLHQQFSHYGVDARSLAVHPGLTASDRQQNQGVGGIISKIAASPIQCGVQPLLRACCDPDCHSGDFIGPKFGIRGRPVKTQITSAASNLITAQRLWDYSSEATRTYFDFKLKTQA